VDWLTWAEFLRCLCQFSQLSHLELDDIGWTPEQQVTAAQLRETLAPLPLQTLLLPFWNRALTTKAPMLVSVLTQPSAQGQPPLLIQWAATLTRLRCTAEVAEASSLLETLASCEWPVLQELQVVLCCRNGRGKLAAPHVTRLKQQLERWLQFAPVLTVFRAGVQCMRRDRCACSELEQLFLQHGRSLTELDLLLSHPDKPLELLRRVGGGAVPQLRRLAVKNTSF